jgi:hypothetical protein
MNSTILKRFSLSKGGDGWRKTFNNFPLDLEFSSYKLFPSEISILLLIYVFIKDLPEKNLKVIQQGEIFKKAIS